MSTLSYACDDTCTTDCGYCKGEGLAYAQSRYLDPFTHGACEALLWADTYVQGTEQNDSPTQADRFWWNAPGWWALQAFDFEDRAKITETCEDFVQANWVDLFSLDPVQCGHDFHLTRNHHGAGFWDRGLGEVGDRLTKASDPYGSASAWCTDPEADDDDPFAHLEEW